MSDGIIKHQNRDDLHGITVVVGGASGRTYVGRWHERQPRGVVLRNATVLEDGSSVDEWLTRLRRFGVPSDHSTLVVPDDEVGEVSRLEA